MKKLRTVFILILSTAVFTAIGSEPATRKIYFWTPSLKLQAYTSLQYNYYPKGDINNKKAFYWGKVLGADGLFFETRWLLPHLIEGNWQEKVYNNQTEKDYIFDLVKDFQDTYAAHGCSVNFLHVHNHHPLYGETVDQWRADVITGMTQNAELSEYAGFAGIFLDGEFTGYDSVSTDPQFWYDLGRDVIIAMKTENPDIKFLFYPGLYNYWKTLSSAEKINPKAIGTYPDQTSIPEAKRNMRHALYQGIYDNIGANELWYHVGWTYRHVHLCYHTPEKTYRFNTHDIITDLMNGHTAMLGPDILYQFGRWDLGAPNMPVPLPSKHYKQPYCHLNGSKRMYEILYSYSDHVCQWTDFGNWDEDNSFYLTYNSIPDFINDLTGVGWLSTYIYDTVTGEEFTIEVAPDASVSEKLDYFVFYGGPEGYHVTGKMADNFTEYVNNLIVAAGKDKITIPIKDITEYAWADEYKQKGFFKNHHLVYTPNDPVYYGYLMPLNCDTFNTSDLNEDCIVNLPDMALLGSRWLEDDDPGDGCNELGDLNNDCTVNFNDLLIMTGQWLYNSGSEPSN